MAISNRPRGLWWSRFHYLIRFLGLTGLIVAGIALTVAWRLSYVQAWPKFGSWEQFTQTARACWEELTTILDGIHGQQPQIVATAFLVGVGLVVLALLVEFLTSLAIVSGRRSAFGTNALIQVGLATALLIGVNVYSFQHYLRLDWTHDPQTGEPKFTLPAHISGQLRQLRGETLVVVYQRHKTFGQITDKPDAYDLAAERKVVEKVKDLVEQFREFGSQFRVEVLDVEDEHFGDRVNGLTENRPELREAIEKAPENSIFFCSTEGKGVQALSFNDFYQLDKTASREQNNLVLLSQGVQPFADKALSVEGKRPKIGIPIIHEYLSSEGWEDYGLGGLKKALQARGFDVQEIVLKRWSQFGPPEPGVYTIEESKLDRLEERLMILDINIKNLQRVTKQLGDLQREWKSASLAELAKKYGEEIGVKTLREDDRTEQLDAIETALTYRQMQLADQEKRRRETLEEKGKLNIDQLAEQRRLSDLQAKFSRLLADCDLLLIPRMTIRNVNTGEAISPRVYKLDDVQVGAIKDFIKSGKPVLACFGPTNESTERQQPLEPTTGPDNLEELLGELGIKFGKQTVLFDQELESFAERRVNLFATGANVKVPAVEFDWKPGEGWPLKYRHNAQGKRRNPVREGLSVTAHGLGKDPEGKGWLLDLRLRHPRPVYFVPPDGKAPVVDPVFLMTSPDSWNESQPFPTRERIPQFEQPKANDPDRNTLDEKRRGPFPIGVIAEVKVPANWYSSKTTPATVRVGAIGQGGFFSGAELSPARETLMLDTINWLLGREEYLPKAEHVWSYPRVELSADDQWLWHWGTQAALPGLFAYLGLVVLLVRRVR